MIERMSSRPSRIIKAVAVLSAAMSFSAACSGDSFDTTELLDVNVTPPELVGINMGRILCSEVVSVDAAPLSIIVEEEFGDGFTGNDRAYLTYVVLPKLNNLDNPNDVHAGSLLKPNDCRRT